ncbi:hypothetical protein BDW75DRAFT_115319 [Aspergillus navahoensis]
MNSWKFFSGFVHYQESSWFGIGSYGRFGPGFPKLPASNPSMATTWIPHSINISRNDTCMHIQHIRCSIAPVSLPSRLRCSHFVIARLFWRFCCSVGFLYLIIFVDFVVSRCYMCALFEIIWDTSSCTVRAKPRLVLNGGGSLPRISLGHDVAMGFMLHFFYGFGLVFTS